MAHKRLVGTAIALLALAIPVIIAAQAAQNAPNAQNDQSQNSSAKSKSQTLKVDVVLVLVNATVTDPQNRYVTGLGQEHFQVWEDKIEQQLAYFSAEDVPVSLGLIFDISGSMKDKISTARDAAVTFLKTGNPDDEYFLVEFANRPEVA